MILFSVDREAFLPFLIVSFVFGIFFGLIYDVFRIRRIAFRRSRRLKRLRTADAVIIFFEDLIFCVFVGIVMILISYKLYFGIPRWYSFFAAVMGVVLWRKTFGKLIMSASDKIICFIYSVLRRIKALIFVPIVSFVAKKIDKVKNKFENNRAKKYTKKYEKAFLEKIKGI